MWKSRYKLVIKYMKKYQIIYADPPWSYRDKALAGNRGAGCKYSVMETKDISKLNMGGG
jgi:N6-adenosine-specific RNA methylase IME4